MNLIDASSFKSQKMIVDSHTPDTSHKRNDLQSFIYFTGANFSSMTEEISANIFQINSNGE